jgi:hypothetical protein
MMTARPDSEHTDLEKAQAMNHWKTLQEERLRRKLMTIKLAIKKLDGLRATGDIEVNTERAIDAFNELVKSVEKI